MRKLIRSLHLELKRKVRAGIQAILEDPYRGKALRGDLEGMSSLAVGRIRIIYRLSSNIVEIVAIGSRKIIYEETSRLIRRNEG